MAFFLISEAVPRHSLSAPPLPSALTLQATQGGKRGVITLCEAGGTLKPSTNFAFGKASRSLQAAYR